MQRHRGRRYEVFISSTFEDLHAVREKLIETTMKAGHIPAGMEFFHAGAPRDIDLIKAAIAQADIFAIFVGARYGSMVSQRGIHFLDFEYQHALHLGKPILAYLLDKNEFKKCRDNLHRDDPERKYDDAIDQFREAVKQTPGGFGRIVEFFHLGAGRPKLYESYATALHQLCESLGGKGGWVRGELYDDLRDKYEEAIVWDKTLSRNPFFRRFVKGLEVFGITSDRFDVLPELKRAIGRYFLDQYLGRMIQGGVRNFFFESGSSIAFETEVFMEYLHDKPWMLNVSPDLRIHTNNFVSYLDLSMFVRVKVELYPYGPPEKRYGATFGPLAILPELEPPLDRSEIKEEAHNAIKEIVDWFDQRYKSAGIILMTTSGIELDASSPFYGPHVGSYYNMLFKRAILESGCPTAMFLDERKLFEKPFKSGDCYPICDSELRWEDVCRAKPFAVGVALTTEAKLDHAKSVLGKFGLGKFETKAVANEIWTLIASNDRFRRLWRDLPEGTAGGGGQP